MLPSLQSITKVAATYGAYHVLVRQSKTALGGYVAACSFLPHAPNFGAAASCTKPPAQAFARCCAAVLPHRCGGCLVRNDGPMAQVVSVPVLPASVPQSVRSGSWSLVSLGPYGSGCYSGFGVLPWA
jgi:hypothetical protein